MEHFRTFYLTGIRHKHQFPFPWSRAQSRWRQTIFLETFPRSLFLGFRSFVPGLNGFYFSFYQKGNEGSLAGLHRSCNNCNSQSHLLPPLQTLSQIRSRLQFATIQSHDLAEVRLEISYFTHFDFLCLKFRGFLTAADPGLSSLSESEVKLVTAEEFLVPSAFSAILNFRIK